MIIISKLLFGSVAVATLAGSVVFTNALETARSFADSMRLDSSAEIRTSDLPQPIAQQPAVRQPGEEGAGSLQLPSALQHCPGSCGIHLMLSQIH